MQPCIWFSELKCDQSPNAVGNCWCQRSEDHKENTKMTAQEAFCLMAI